MSISKREFLAEKAIAHTSIWLEKRKKWFVLNCMVPKPKAKLLKFIQNLYGIDSKKFELFWSKVCKMEAHQKTFNQL